MNKLQEKADSAELGLYVHVPFCARPCDFCHFYQEAPRRTEIEAYLEGMEVSFARNPPPRPAQTAFWGGGTPGLLPAPDLLKLGEAMLKANHGVIPAEWTVEMAPATVKQDKMEVFKRLGVSRISMGIQTFNQRLLEALGRIHSIKQIHRAMDCLRSAGFENFNLDLIFAIPGQTLDEWEEDLRKVIDAGPAHISTYCLTFEEDTALWIRLQKGQVKRKSIEDEAEFHQFAWRILGDAGYPQYEVSNFSRPGHACRHNINTWRMQEWLGYGPSASSQFGGRRWTEPHSISRWLEGCRSGKPEFEDEVELTGRMLAEDFLIFGLRMNEGVDLDEWHRRFGNRALPGWDAFLGRLIDEQLAIASGSRIQLTDTGRLVADRIGSEILELG